MINTNSQLTTHSSKFTTPALRPPRRASASVHHSQSTILLIISFSFALNLHALAGDSFWGDEILTAIFAGQSPAEVIRWTAEDIHPPLYYLVAGNLTRLLVPPGTSQAPTAASDWLWRFPSVIAVVLTVVITHKLALHVIRPNQNSQAVAVAAAAALLLSLAPVVIKYGQEARMHAMFMCLAALSTLLFFRAMARSRSWFRWLAYALASTACIYTMYFGFLILASHTGYLLFWILDTCARSPWRSQCRCFRYTNSSWRRSNPKSKITDHKSQVVGFTAAMTMAFLFYLPWWPVLFNLLRQRAAVGAIEGGVGHPTDFIRGVVRALGPMPEPVAWIFLILFIVGLVLMARRNWPMAAFALLWLGLPVALPIVLGDPRALQFRYAFVLPIYLILIVFSVFELAGWLARRLENYSQFTFHNSHFTTHHSMVHYLIWILATLSFISTLGIYQQTKPDWRAAAAYLDQHTTAADIILIGPLWDEGRFIDYYYRGQAQLLTPAALVTNIERRVESLRAGAGRVWAVNRYAPAESPVARNVLFSGVVVSEPTLAVYEPALLAEAAIDLAAQATEAAYPWAAEAEAQGVLNPDPRTARAAALRAWGDALVAAGRPKEALRPYQTAVDIFPGWVNGFMALAETQEIVGNQAAAAEAYRQAVAFSLDWQGLLADEAAAFVDAGQWAAALEKYHQIIDEP